MSATPHPALKDIGDWAWQIRDTLSRLADRAHLQEDEPLGKKWLAAMKNVEALAAAAHQGARRKQL